MKRFLEFIEKRLHPRYSVDASVLFDVVDGSSLDKVTGPHKATLTDISKKGCSLVVEKVIFGGFYLLKCLDDGESHYIIRVALSTDAPNAPSEFTGRIIWLDNTSEYGDRRFKIGLELLPPMNTKTLTDLRKALTKPSAHVGAE